MNDDQTMRKLGLSVAAGLMMLAACDSSPDAGPLAHETGHETGHDQGADPATDKPAFLSQLIFIRGHLLAGSALYASGDAEAAAVHMKHPEDELYADLKPAFAAWDAREFASELQALAASVEGRAAQDRVATDLAAVRSAIDQAADAVRPTPKEMLLAVAATLRTAAEEFDLATEGTRIVNAREYQDAHGFMTTALDYLERLETADATALSALTVAREQASLALTVAPSVVPPETVTTRAATIYEAAARIEQEAERLE